MLVTQQVFGHVVLVCATENNSCASLGHGNVTAEKYMNADHVHCRAMDRGNGSVKMLLQRMLLLVQSIVQGAQQQCFTSVNNGRQQAAYLFSSHVHGSSC